MLNLLFVATLFCLLPSLITVSVVPLQLSPSFWQLNKEDPCVWSDGALSLHNGKVSVSVGQASSLLVVSEGEMQAPLFNLHTTLELTEPDSYIFIVTEKAGVHSTIENRNDYIIRFAHHTLYGEGIDTRNSNEQSFFESAILITIQPNPVTEVFDVEEFKNTNGVLSSTEYREILDLDFDSVLASEDTGLNDNDFETQNNLVDLFNDDIPQSTTNIETSNLFQEADQTIEQDTLNNNVVHTEVQNQPSENNLKGEQFKLVRYEEPMIYASNGLVKKPQLVNSLTGEIRQLFYSDLYPYTGEYRIPDDTKLLIVKWGNCVKYYKNITLGSKVWYLRRDEKVFYPCIVQIFSINNRKTMLKCIGHEPKLVPNFSWDDIFPIEAADLIKDMGNFKVQREDINWNDLSKQKETGILQHEEREQQYSWNNFASSFFVHKKPSDKEWIIIDSINGEFRSVDPKELVKMKENDERRIPRETKITDDRQSRFIVLESEIYYHWKNKKVLIKGRVESMHDKRVAIKCINGKRFSKVKWENVYPIESYEIIKDFAPVWKPETSKALPLKRKNTKKENVIQKERRIDDGARVNNLQNNNILLIDESFLFGEQLSHKGKVHHPFIFLSSSKDGMFCRIIDTEKGKVSRRHYNKFSRLPTKYQISKQTKISEDGKLKIILPNSGVLYRNSDGIYYPCKVTKLSHGKSIKITCDTLGEFTPKWDEMFPIEALSTLPKPIKIPGFEEGEAVTLDMLRDKIDAIPKARGKK